jgi:hypothetical protein
MSSYIFKNLLIIDRASSHSDSIKAAQHHNYWFKPLQPFDYHTGNDKVILCYPQEISQESSQIHIQTNSPFNVTDTPDGAFHILIDKTDIKVLNATFKSYDKLQKHILSLKQYIIQCIKDLSSYSPHSTSYTSRNTVILTYFPKYTLYWSNSLSADILTIATASGLISNISDSSHTF